MRQYNCVAVASVLVCMLAVGMYVCDVPVSIVWLLCLIGLLLFLIINVLVVGSATAEIKKVEREISRHYKERGW